jgi:diguanylate cyclase (GGDEF)-like protein/putative nucleotidyltransferase with HDIG domain
MPQNRAWPASVYVWSVVGLGAAVIATSSLEFYQQPLRFEWFVLAALTLISGSATVKLPSVPATISVSETFVFSSVLLFGAPAGTLTVVLDGLVMSIWVARQNLQPQRLLFNVTATALSVWTGAQVFFFTAAVPPLVERSSSIQELLLPLILFALVYFSVNSWLIAFAISFETGQSPAKIWRRNFMWLSLNYFCGASVAVLLVVYTRSLDFQYLAVIIPLLLVLYLTFKTSMGRVEDANRHLKQLNSLYLSTIETLAMAIDAKDQITHGHIRRVQGYAVGLARELGIKDETLIKAIEAAALLHDMGKLAVPEYILNKPGKLTAAEFEKMKLHASVGADILSSIEFPYPVVPMVRHHHENWTGGGYPDGLKGTDIPIGARILAVVDCFDALTSDRPYRPRLSDEEALSILIDRRGTMYDPLVVDTFLRVYKDIAPLDEPAPTRVGLTAITESVQPAAADASQPTTDEGILDADEVLSIHQLARTLPKTIGLIQAADLVSAHLKRIFPAQLIAYFMYEPTQDRLRATHVVGDGAEHVLGMAIPTGHRLTGWVAANRQPILNSDPTLDLGDVSDRLPVVLKSCLSVPLVTDDQLVAVLTLYSSSRDAFGTDHQRLAVALSRHLGHILRESLEYDRAEGAKLRDPLTGLPNSEHLRRFLDSDLPLDRVVGLPCSLLFLVVRKRDVSRHDRHGRVDDELIKRFAHEAKKILRGGDILFRYGLAEFVIVLPQTDAPAGMAVAARIADAVAIRGLGPTAPLSDVDLEVAVVTAPDDGGFIQELMPVAADRLRPAHYFCGSRSQASFLTH